MSKLDDYTLPFSSSQMRKGSKLIKQSTGKDFEFSDKTPLDHINILCDDETKTTKQIRFDKSNTLNDTKPASFINRKFNNGSHHSSIDFYRLKLSKSKLKAVTRTSALLSGFAMVAMVELGLDYSSLTDYSNEYSIRPKIFKQLITNSTLNSTKIEQTTIVQHIVNDKFVIPQSILILYALVTCLLVGVHMLALMISTCILPQIEALSFENIDFEHHYLQRQDLTLMSQNLTSDTNQVLDDHESTGVNIDHSMSTFNRRNFDFSRTNYHPVGYDSILNDTNIMFPYIQYHRFIELAWISSTVIGIFLFLVEIGLVCYIKFYPISFFAALTGAIVMVPILVLFVVFTITFYKRLAGFKVNLTKKVLSQVDSNSIPMKTNII